MTWEDEEEEAGMGFSYESSSVSTGGITTDASPLDPSSDKEDDEVDDSLVIKIWAEVKLVELTFNVRDVLVQFWNSRHKTAAGLVVLEWQREEMREKRDEWENESLA